MNRRHLLLLPILAIPFLNNREIIVEKGIRFLDKYPKEVYYDPDRAFSTSSSFFRFWTEPNMKYTPAPLSVYAQIIEEQKKLGWTEWELI